MDEVQPSLILGGVAEKKKKKKKGKKTEVSNHSPYVSCHPNSSIIFHFLFSFFIFHFLPPRNPSSTKKTVTLMLFLVFLGTKGIGMLGINFLLHHL